MKSSALMSCQDLFRCSRLGIRLWAHASNAWIRFKSDVWISSCLLIRGWSEPGSDDKTYRIYWKSPLAIVSSHGLPGQRREESSHKLESARGVQSFSPATYEKTSTGLALLRQNLEHEPVHFVAWVAGPRNFGSIIRPLRCTLIDYMLLAT